MASNSEYDNATKWLEDCRRPLLLTHRGPDGDALGGLAALAGALRQRGQSPQVELYEPLPRRYELLADAADWQMWESSRAALEASCDAVVVLDTCAYTQLEPVADFLPQAPRTLVLDHHATRDAVGTRPGDLRLIDEEAAAVCVLIAEWAWRAGVRLDGPLATPLLVGIGTDCGWFRFANTDARTLQVAAKLVAAGAQPDGIYASIYERDTPERLRLAGRVLDSLELHAGGRLAVMYLRLADFAALGMDATDTEDLVNEARRLGSAEAAILFTEQPDNIRINFRSKGALDVSALARQFGGGGHTRASGARVRAEWDECVRAVVTAACAALGA